MARRADEAPSLFRRLVDDAGLFPPASLEMTAALSRHRDERVAGNPMLSGRFVCRLDHLDAHGRELAAADLPLSLVVDGHDAAQMLALERAASDFGDRLEAVELDAWDLTDRDELVRTIDAARHIGGVQELYVEVGWGTAYTERLEVVGRAGAGAKFRCGGVWESAFPSVSELATALTEVAGRGMAWKATAGLHTAVRGVDPRDGLVHHGFLNLLLATEAATSGAPGARVAQLLASGDAGALAELAHSLTAEAIARTRASFVRYGSCELREPVDELARLGLGGDDGDAPAVRSA